MERVGDPDAVRSSRVTLGKPHPFENGAMVPVRVVVDSPVIEEGHVTAIYIFFAPDDPVAYVASFMLMPLAGRRSRPSPGGTAERQGRGQWRPGSSFDPLADQ